MKGNIIGILQKKPRSWELLEKILQYAIPITIAVTQKENTFISTLLEINMVE